MHQRWSDGARVTLSVRNGCSEHDVIFRRLKYLRWDVAVRLRKASRQSVGHAGNITS